MMNSVDIRSEAVTEQKGVTASAQPLARQLARFALGLKPGDLSEPRRSKLPLILADFVGCVYAGSVLPEAQSAFVLAQSGDVLIPGHDKAMTPQSAAIAMGTLGSLLQIHDGYGGGGNHPCCSIIPALWCMREGRPMSDLYMAIAVGYEVANRIAYSSHPAQTLAGMTPTSSTGAIGATAALGRLLGLDEKMLTAALSNAAFMLPIAALRGLTEHGSAIPLHGGLAARCAIDAVSLAQAGLCAGQRVLEGESDPGLLDLIHSNKSSLQPDLWKGETLDGVYFKPIPACRHAQPAIEAILAIFKDGSIDPEEIASIDIHTYPVAMRFGSPPAPEHELYDRLMSVSWAVASTLAKGGYDLDNVLAPSREASVQALYPLIHSHIDKEFTRAYPRCFSQRVEISMKDGVVKKGQCMMEYGVPRELGPYSPKGTTTPALDYTGLKNKFMNFVQRRLSSSDATSLWDMLTLE